MCLKDFCDEAIAKFPPLVDAETGQIKYTYCNVGVDYIARRMGCDDFHGPAGVFLADKICNILSKGWINITSDDAFSLAKQGTLIVAGLSSKELRATHGHVTIVYPAENMLYSGSWKKLVPMLANVGKINGVLKASQCFPIEPKYYLRPGGNFHRR